MEWGISLPTAALAMGKPGERSGTSVVATEPSSPRHNALYSSLDEAIATLGDAQLGDTIYLVTDGGENHSTINKHRILTNLISRGIRVFVFLVLPSEPYKT